MDDSAITCDEVIDSYHEETHFNKYKAKFQHFTCIFINYHFIIDRC